MISAGLLMAASLISTLVSGTMSYISNTANMKAQQQINKMNVEAQQDINQQNIDYSREFAQNNMQWKMEDLQNAGLNPVLAAGFSGSSPQPTAMSAPVQKAPTLDLSGISSAITAMNNMMLSSYLMSQRNEIASQNVGVNSQRNDVMRERNQVLDNLYRRKRLALESSVASPMVANSKQMRQFWKDQESKMSQKDKDEWDNIMKELGYRKKH